MQKINRKNGITLVALVVTIIVLMILAGITLSLILGSNGLIEKAQQAKNLSVNADKATEENLNSLYNELESGTGEPVLPTIESTETGNIISSTNNTAIKDDNGNIVVIPAGFKIANDSDTKQENGIVIEDNDGNQFVWIPVTNISNYERTDFGTDFDGGISYSNYSETMPTDEQTSVSKYHGYYIGRYETGDKESTANKILRNSSVTTNTATIKKGQAPYNYVTRDQAKMIAEGMKAKENYKGTTKICSSYAWDTAINFIQNKAASYGTSSNQGNYNDTTFTYTDITGITQTKAANSWVLTPTGQTISICNIYDMGGNDWEWTSETNNDATYTCVPRGGSFGDNYATIPAGTRGPNTADYNGANATFRIAFYM